MPKNSKGHKRHPSRTKRAHSHKRRTHRKRGGADALEGASVKYSLAGSWPSRMSLGQGQDYFKYHVGQHGGMTSDANIGGAPLRAISDSMLPQNLRMAAHIDGLDKAIDYSRQFKDPNQAGGRRRSHHCKKHGKKHCKCHKSHGKSHCHSKRSSHSKRHHSKRHGKSHRHSKRHGKTHHKRSHRKRGGNMGYAPFPNKGMLLDSPKEYAQAGLNPQWKTDVAFDMAEVRSTQ